MRRKRRWQSIFAVLGSLVCWPRPVAHAQALDFALQLDVPAELRCTSAAALERAIEERIGRLVFLGLPEPSRLIHVVIARSGVPEVYRMHVVVLDERGRIVGERTLAEAVAACRDLDPTLLLVLSTLIGVADESVSVSAAHASSAAQPPPTRRVAEQHGETTASPLTFITQASARAELGWLPGIAAGGEVGLGLASGHWLVGVGAGLMAPSSQSLERGAQARFLAVEGSAQLCAAPTPLPSAVLALCVATEVAALSVRISRSQPALRAATAAVASPALWADGLPEAAAMRRSSVTISPS